MHGFHIHTLGDLSAGCESTGNHFNPEGMMHGGQTSPAGERHVGDLGNIMSDEVGNSIQTTVEDNMISLDPNSPNYIIGRACVVHIAADDLGLGGQSCSLLNGCAGLKIGCGAVGINIL
jgi:Cu-Zn family superoxide dismutase